MAEKALADISSEQTAAADGDLLFIESAGVPAKITWGNLKQVPALTGKALQFMRVNAGETATEFAALGGAALVDVIDEDNMATDSATRPPSQQSAKAYTESYADAAIAASSPIIARITLNQATDTIINSFGIASIANQATGRTRITFSDTQPSNEYQVVCTTTGQGGDVTALWSNTANFGAPANKTTTYFDIHSTTGGGSATNSEYVCVLVFGD